VSSSNTKESRVRIVANPPQQAIRELLSSRQTQIQTTHAMKSLVYLLWWLHADFHRLAEALTAKADLFLMYMQGIIKLHIGWCECVGYGSWIGVTWGALRYSFKRWGLFEMQMKMKWSCLSVGSKIVFSVYIIACCGVRKSLHRLNRFVHILIPSTSVLSDSYHCSITVP